MKPERGYPALCFFFFYPLMWGVTDVMCQTPGEWTWMHGDNNLGGPGVFGIQGVSNPANKPPVLYEPCEWKDNNGKFWLFGGGYGVDCYSALWKYDPNSGSTYNQWTWMKGPSNLNQLGVYGTKGVSSPTNFPGARGWGALTWTDTSGNLWLFGGLGYSATGGKGYLNDLWKYDPNPASPTYNQWTWMQGSNAINDTGSYGIQGVANASNLPPSRHETSCSWTDNAGDLWLYGGVSGKGLLNDLWKYSVATNEWTWIHGASMVDLPAVYGIQGVPASANTPGGRLVYCSWTDSAGDLWLFGGDETWGRLNDLWKYNITSNQWTWMGGSNIINDAGSFGSKCVSAKSNVPPSRTENRARVRDGCGNFWSFGGGDTFGTDANDLWHYNVTTNEWTWVSGDNIPNQTAVYGTKGVSSPASKPGAKIGSVAWMDNTGYIWVFGGWASNDLFRYMPDPTCVPFSPFVATSSNTTICSGQSATLSASGGNNYLWSPGGQSTSSIVVSPTISTTYTVSCSNACGTGSSVTTVTITPPLTITTSSDVTICTGQVATLSASGGINYSWSPGGMSSSSILVSPTTSITYTLIASNSCNVDSSLVGVVVNPVPAITFSSTNVLCNGGKDGAGVVSAVGGTPPYIYSWNTNPVQYTSAANGLTAGNYMATITDAGGCISKQVITITEPSALTIIANATPTACDENTGTATANVSGGTGAFAYAWDPTNHITLTATGLGVGNYILTVTDSNGCTGAQVVTIALNDFSREIFLPNIFSPNNDGENDEFCLQGGIEVCLISLDILIYNRWGEKIFESMDPKFCWDGTYAGKQINTDTFVYYVEATFISEETIIKRGSISLIR